MIDRTQLSNFLTKRGLNEPNETPNREAILANEQLTASIAGVWRENKQAIEAVILARIAHNQKYLMDEAIPEEVVIYRQLFLELGAVLSDFESYTAEQDRRDKERHEGVPAEPDNQPDGK